MLAGVYILLTLIAVSIRNTRGKLESHFSHKTSLLEAVDNGYNKLHIPEGSPLKVTINMVIVSIGTFNEQKMTFDIEMYFRQMWDDHRLSYNGYEEYETITGDETEKIWEPDTFFENEKIAYFHEITKKNKFTRIAKNGSITSSLRLTLTLSCVMDFRKFPLDEQICGLIIASYGYSDRQIIYRWYEGEKDTIVQVLNKDSTLFHMEIYVIEELTRVFTTGNFSTLQIKFKFTRRIHHYLIRMYAPAVLVVVVSWLSFWIEKDSPPARVSLGITTVLTITTLLIGIGGSTTPEVSYIKALDLYLIVCFAFVFGSFVEFAVVNFTEGKRRALRKMNKDLILENYINKKINSGGGLRTFDEFGTFSEVGQETREEVEKENFDEYFTIHRNRISPIHTNKKTERSCSVELNKKDNDSSKIKYTRPGTSPIDFWSRVFFPLFFALFNVGYFTYYLS